MQWIVGGLLLVMVYLLARLWLPVLLQSDILARLSSPVTLFVFVAGAVVTLMAVSLAMASDTTVGSEQDLAIGGRDSVSSDQYLVLSEQDSADGELLDSALGVQPSTMQSVPSPWVASDVGSVSHTGSSSESSGTFTLTGGGYDIGGTTDELHFVYQTLSGDGEIIALPATQTNSHDRAKAGVMIRESLDTGSPEVFIGRMPGSGNNVISLDRVSSNTSTTRTQLHYSTVPPWVKLTRTGNDFSTYYSADGVTWIHHKTTTVSMAQTVYIGLAVSSRTNAATTTATFTNVSVSGGGTVTATPTGTTPATATSTNTPAPGSTATSTPTSTATSEATNTATPTETATNTPVAGQGRVTDGLQVLYTFYEGSGSVVHDVSGVGTAYDLTISDPISTTWLSGGGLSIDSNWTVITGTAATKIISAAKSSGEITIEAWIKPESTSQQGPARILTISGDSSNRNVMLGQGMWLGNDLDKYSVRLRTSDSSTDANGAPEFLSGANEVSTALTHVVYTFDTTGNAVLYVDGVQSSSGTVAGNLNNWDSSYPLMLGNETTLDREWLGELHLVAVYDKALSSAEVTQNYTAGQTQATPTSTNTPATTSTATPTATSTPVATSTATPTSEATSTPTNTPDPPPASGYTVTQRITLSLAGQPIAVRAIIMDENGSVITSRIRHLLTDHLGSTSQVVYHHNSEVVEGSTARYKPFGGYRTTPTNNDTDMGFTGHKENRDIGLTYMNARFYVPGVGKFASADTIVPDPSNPQAYNRFSYGYNNPVKYTDPTGHDPSYCADQYESAGDTACNHTSNPLPLPPKGDGQPITGIELDGTSNLGDVNHDVADNPPCIPGSTYAECWQQFRVLDLADPHELDIPQLFEMLLIMYAELYEADTLSSIARIEYDTPFYRGGEHNSLICLGNGEESCSRRSSVNYIAQGAWSARIGDSEQDLINTIVLFKSASLVGEELFYGNIFSLRIEDFENSVTTETIEWALFGYYSYQIYENYRDIVTGNN